MKKIWCNGCFDVLHYGHFKLLKHASSIGDLHIGIDTDRRVKENKGINRPFHNQNQRLEILSSFNFVKKVYIFDTDEELINIIKSLEPDLMVIGTDYKDKNIIGSEYIKEISYFNKLDGLSSTQILKLWDIQ